MATAKIGGGKPPAINLKKLHGTAAAQPGQGKRSADSGAGGTASLAGRGTKEQK